MKVTFSVGDKVFGKVKGHPHWPARINKLPEDVKIPKGKYPIFFYGTHEVYYLMPKDIYHYEKYKDKYGVPKNRPLFSEGLKEIIANPNVLLYGEDPAAEKFLLRFYKFRPTFSEVDNVSSDTEPLSKKRRISNTSMVADKPVKNEEKLSLTFQKTADSWIAKTPNKVGHVTKPKSSKKKPDDSVSLSSLSADSDDEPLQMMKEKVQEVNQRVSKHGSEIKESKSGISSLKKLSSVKLTIKKPVLKLEKPVLNVEKPLPSTTKLGRPMRDSARALLSRMQKGQLKKHSTGSSDDSEDESFSDANSEEENSVDDDLSSIDGINDQPINTKQSKFCHLSASSDDSNDLPKKEPTIKSAKPKSINAKKSKFRHLSVSSLSDDSNKLSKKEPTIKPAKPKSVNPKQSKFRHLSVSSLSDDSSDLSEKEATIKPAKPKPVKQSKNRLPQSNNVTKDEPHTVLTLHKSISSVPDDHIGVSNIAGYNNLKEASNIDKKRENLSVSSADLTINEKQHQYEYKVKDIGDIPHSQSKEPYEENKIASKSDVTTEPMTTKVSAKANNVSTKLSPVDTKHSNELGTQMRRQFPVKEGTVRKTTALVRPMVHACNEVEKTQTNTSLTNITNSATRSSTIESQNTIHSVHSSSSSTEPDDESAQSSSPIVPAIKHKRNRTSVSAKKPIHRSKPAATRRRIIDSEASDRTGNSPSVQTSDDETVRNYQSSSVKRNHNRALKKRSIYSSDENSQKDIMLEAELLIINRDIQSSLLLGEEDFQKCLSQLKTLKEMKIPLPILVKCWNLVNTIRKCRRYKRSEEVKEEAGTVFNKFLHIYANAEKSDVITAQMELLQMEKNRLESKRKINPNDGFPTGLTDLFSNKVSVLADTSSMVKQEIAVGSDTRPSIVIGSSNSSLTTKDHNSPAVKSESVDVSGSVCSFPSLVQPPNPPFLHDTPQKKSLFSTGFLRMVKGGKFKVMDKFEEKATVHREMKPSTVVTAVDLQPKSEVSGLEKRIAGLIDEKIDKDSDLYCLLGV